MLRKIPIVKNNHKSMNKEKFIELVTELCALRKAEDNLNIAFKVFEPDFNYVCFGRYESLIVKSIKIAVGDEYDYLSYWLYDLDLGRNAKKGSVTDKNGKSIPIKTISNLYDLIVKMK